ncbi:hypothetical protein WA158_000050 [Blastocystis sp. Blastoise]
MGYQKKLILVFLTVFIDAAGFSFVLPILPTLTSSLGGGSVEMSLLSSCYALTQALSAYIMGTLSDKYGRRAFLLLSLFGSVSGPLLQAFCGNIPLLVLCRAYTGLLGGSQTIGQAYIADVVPHDQRPKFMAEMGAFLSCAFVFGPAIGGFLGQISLQAPFFAAALLALVVFILSIFFLKETNPVILKKTNLKQQKKVLLQRTALSEDESRLVDDINQQLKEIETNSHKKQEKVKIPWNTFIIFMIISRFLAEGLCILYDSTYGFYVKEVLNGSSLDYSWLLMATGIGTGINQLFIFPWLSQKLKLSLVAIGIIGAVLTMIGQILMCVIPYLWFAYISGTMMFIGYSMIIPIIPSILTAQTPSSVHGQVLSFGMMAGQIAMILEPLLTGWIYTFSPVGSIWAGVANAILLVILMITLFMMKGGRTCHVSLYPDLSEEQKTSVDDKELVTPIPKEDKDIDNQDIHIVIPVISSDIDPSAATASPLNSPLPTETVLEGSQTRSSSES